MKSYWTILGLICSIQVQATPLKIPLCLEKTTYLYFAAPIQYAHCGAAVQAGEGSVFIGQAPEDRHLLQLIAAKEHFTATNLLVKTTAGYYTFELYYEAVPKKSFYRVDPNMAQVFLTGQNVQTGIALPINTLGGDHSKAEEETYTTTGKTKTSRFTGSPVPKETPKRIEALCEQVVPYLTRDYSLKQGIALGIGGVYATNQYVFFPLIIVNRSGLSFEIEAFEFIVEKRQKGSKLKGNAYLQGGEETLVPYTICKPLSLIKAGEEKQTVAVFEKFSLGTGQQLRIAVKEKQGRREVSHVVVQKRFLKARGW